MSVNKKIIETEAAALAEAKFAVTLWTGNATTGSATRDINVGFAPDIYWIRGRNFNTNVWINRIRGGGKGLSPHSSNVEDTSRSEVLQDTGIQLVGTSVNYNGEKAVMYSWGGGTTEQSNTDGSITTTVRANTEAGYSIINYTGNGTQGATIGHGLNSAPEFFVIKNLDNTAQTESWNVYNVVSGNNRYLFLNSDTAGGTTTAYDNTTPSSSTISIGNYSGVNYNGDNLMCFAFHSVSGYSKIGSYTGNGTASTSNPIVTCGFRPDLIIIKRATTTGPWFFFDSQRDSNTAPRLDTFQVINNANNEASGGLSTDYIRLESTGFRSTSDAPSLNGGSVQFLFMAFKIQP